MLRVYFFTKLRILCDGQPLPLPEGGKTQELLSYLLLHHRNHYRREQLANVLWADSDSMQSRKYLRQALWQLQNVLPNLLFADANWLMIDPQAAIWIDVEEFKTTYQQIIGNPIHTLTHSSFQKIQSAAKLYTGSLLEGWCQDWTLFERERLQNAYLLLLGKLMGYCELHALYELGLIYGEQVLRIDGAHEPTHQRMMRFHYCTGNRTGALRQYANCVTALKNDLHVKPSRQTQALYEQICDDSLGLPSRIDHSSLSVSEMLSSLNELRQALTSLTQKLH